MGADTGSALQAELSFGLRYFAAISRFLSKFAQFLPQTLKESNSTPQADRDSEFCPGFELGLYLCHPGFARWQHGRLRISGTYLDCGHFSLAGN
jgi:hypothetical protein